MPSKLTMRELLETGVHFGHRTQKWNPKMAPFIYAARNGIHIIDLRQTFTNLNSFYDMVVEIARKNGTVLFVGTKRQAQDTVAAEAARCGMPYVNQRWLGGTLTNWRTIKDRIDTLKKLEIRREKGEFKLLTKREALMLEREIIALNERLGGIREMRRLPDLVVVVDTKREETAVKEANSLNIPVLALADTNSDPDTIDYIVPGNDDAMRAIKLVVGAIADAVLEGKAMRKGEDAEQGDDFATAMGNVPAASIDFEDDEDAKDERYLGESTLAKLRSAQLDFDEEEK
ncbi:MAG: 30S ribosomal protein S2 [Anaerolineae bacterium]|jgi:small subunit ribosomal protein S2|nr:30S ribosomal protein S2 [Anaerolineae bacterium]